MARQNAFGRPEKDSICQSTNLTILFTKFPAMA